MNNFPSTDIPFENVQGIKSTSKIIKKILFALNSFITSVIISFITIDIFLLCQGKYPLVQYSPLLVLDSLFMFVIPQLLMSVINILHDTHFPIRERSFLLIMAFFMEFLSFICPLVYILVYILAGYFCLGAFWVLLGFMLVFAKVFQLILRIMAIFVENDIW